MIGKGITRTMKKATNKSERSGAVGAVVKVEVGEIVESLLVLSAIGVKMLAGVGTLPGPAVAAAAAVGANDDGRMEIWVEMAGTGNVGAMALASHR